MVSTRVRLMVVLAILVVSGMLMFGAQSKFSKVSLEQCFNGQTLSEETLLSPCSTSGSQQWNKSDSSSGTSSSMR